MATTTVHTMRRYQQPIWGQMDRTLRNCFRGALVIGVLVVVGVFVAPAPHLEPTDISHVPERLARLILQPKPAAPTIQLPKQTAVEQPEVEKSPEPKPVAKQPPRRRTSKPKLTENRGQQGRERAQKEVTQNLAAVTGSLDKVIDNLSKSLPASENGDAAREKKPRRRRRGVRSGRTTQQLSSVQGAKNLSSAEMSSSAIEGEGISISAITDLDVTASGNPNTPQTSGGGSGSPASGGDIRSNASLLSVVRRYAPGIQFCYDNELKKKPDLRGKLVVSLTVLADGSVSEVLVVDDSLKSGAVRNCVLAQIRGWQFPAIPQGVVSFKTPFIFTPPN